MFLNFTDKNVLITGGSRGIGRACAIMFANLNANVVITYKSNIREAERTIEMLKENQHHSLYQLDITQPKNIETCFNNIMQKYNKLDVLVNNAGIFIEHKINEVSYETWQQIWNETIMTNLTGVSNPCYFAA